MASRSDFDKFLSNISPSKSAVDYIISVHINIRDFLKNNLGAKIIKTYLTGSYAKHTNIKPRLDDGKSDVDIAVIMSYSCMDSSIDVLKELNNTLIKNKRYQNTKLQTHSIRVTMSGIDIDIVPLVVGDNGETYIGNSKVNRWELTNPKGHIQWASNVNKGNGGKFIPIVKILKWWKRQNLGEDHKYPKGIGLEKIIADNISSTDSSIEKCLVDTMNKILLEYQLEIVLAQVPVIKDPCIPANNLFAKVEFKQFKKFIDKMDEHLQLLEKDNGNSTWRKILGPEFPLGDRQSNTSIRERGPEENFIDELVDVDTRYYAKIDCVIRQNGFRPFSSGDKIIPLKHNLDLDFTVTTDTPKPYKIFWKIRNVGDEAMKLDKIRGQILKTNKRKHHEPTAFQGPHYVECYIIKDNKCVASAHIDVPIE